MGVTAININEDFMDGFEKGMMERENENVFYDQDCEMAKSDNKDLQFVLNIANTYRSFVGVLENKDNVLSKMTDTVFFFVENLGQMMNIFSTYEGSDYCAGLNFGITGAFILTNIADSFKYVSTLTAP